MLTTGSRCHNSGAAAAVVQNVCRGKVVIVCSSKSVFATANVDFGAITFHRLGLWWQPPTAQDAMKKTATSLLHGECVCVCVCVSLL